MPAENSFGANYWKKLAGRGSEPLSESVVRLLACPDDDAPLEWREQTGSLHCLSCAREFPIIDGIIRALPSADFYQLSAAELEELTADRAAVDRTVADPLAQFGAQWAKALELAGDVDGKAVLDPACGTGWAVAEFAARGALAFGADAVAGPGALADAEALRRQRGLNFYFVQGDVARLPFAAESFDLIFIARALHFLRRPERLLHEAARLIKPDGRIVNFGEPIGKVTRGAASLDLRKAGSDRTAADYAAMFREAGLEVQVHFPDTNQPAKGLAGRLRHHLRSTSGQEARLFVGRRPPERQLPQIRMPWQRRIVE